MLCFKSHLKLIKFTHHLKPPNHFTSALLLHTHYNAPSGLVGSCITIRVSVPSLALKVYIFLRITWSSIYCVSKHFEVSEGWSNRIISNSSARTQLPSFHHLPSSDHWNWERKKHEKIPAHVQLHVNCIKKLKKGMAYSILFLMERLQFNKLETLKQNKYNNNMQFLRTCRYLKTIYIFYILY